MRPPPRRAVLLTGGLVALLAITVPAIAADPSPSAEAPGQTKAKAAGKPDKGPEIAATVRGKVEKSTDEKGRPTYTITVDGTTWELSAGPKWYWGDKSPLAAHVGKTVEVTGTHREGATDLDVETVGGEAIRAAGKPPWAGGPKAVGEAHPGWKAWKAEGKPGKALGVEGAPGQLKDKSADESPAP